MRRNNRSSETRVEFRSKYEVRLLIFMVLFVESRDLSGQWIVAWIVSTAINEFYSTAQQRKQVSRTILKEAPLTFR